MGKRRSPVEYPIIDADIVWAAACAAQRVNGTYHRLAFKADENSAPIPPNKQVMREFLTNPQGLTAQDYQQANVVRTYWRNKLFDVLNGTAGDFTTKAMELANQENFKLNDYFSLGTIAYLPAGFEKGQLRDQQREQKIQASIVSEHFGNVGDKVSGTATIVDCRFSINYNVFYVSAKLGSNLIMFPYRKNLETGHIVEIKGSIKAHRDDNITQLTRVRITKEEK